MRVLLVEDDRAVSLGVQHALEREGWRVDALADGEQACSVGLLGQHDLAVLDLGLPRKDGLAVLRSLRARGQRLPVLIATARDAVADRVAGLDAGADDYIVKPYDLDELLARIRALRRRADGRAEPAYEWGDVRIVPATRQVTLRGQPVALSAREWAVLEPLLARPGRVLSRQQLEDKLYSWRDDISSNAVEVYIHGVRKKLGAGLIENVRGLGYLVPAAPPRGEGV